MTNLFLSFLEISMSVGAAALVLLLLSPFLSRRYASRWQYWTWIFLALRLLIPFSGAGALLQELPRFWRQQGSHGADVTNIANPGRVIVTLPRQVTTVLAAQDHESAAFTVLDGFAVLWLIGAVVFLAVHLLSYLYYKRRLTKSGRAEKNPDTLRLLKRLKSDMHVRQMVSIMISDEAESPMAMGFFRYILILPDDRYSSQELYFIMKHELAHLQAADTYGKLLLVAANAVHWFNPAVYLMRGAAVLDMELSCDERVTGKSSYEERKAYTEALLASLSRGCAKRSTLTTQFYGGKRVMKKRFQNILNKKRKKNGWHVLAAAVLLTVSLGALIGCSVAKEPSVSGDVFAQIAGAWMIDFDRTDPALWGTGISYGDALEITETGALTYYIGIGVGGTGQCVEKDGEVTVEIEPYEAHSSEPEILTLRYENEDGAETIRMDWHGEQVYWVRGSVSADGGQADSTDFEAFEAAVDGFVQAYFGGDGDAMRQYLSDGYDGDYETYPGSEPAADMTVKGLPENEAELADGSWSVSVEFREGAQADSFFYLTIDLVREGDEWKVRFFGLEG